MDAMTMGDRIVVMNNAVGKQTDTPLELYIRPENLFDAGFLGSPPMNFLNGTLQEEGESVVFSEIAGGAIKVKLAKKGLRALSGFLAKPLLLGIRPEDIELAQFGKPDESTWSFPAIVDIV